MTVEYSFFLGYENIPLINKSVGNNPTSVATHRDASGIIYAFTSDAGSNRFSVCALSGVDGILSSSVIGDSALITKSVGIGTRSITTHRDASGILYVFTADNDSNRFSVCAASGIDGILSSSVIANATLITKSVGNNPHSIIVHRDVSGVLYALTADLTSNRFSVCALSGIDGILSSSVIANTTLITRAVGADPHSIAVHRDASGILYVFTADILSNRFSVCAASGIDGILSSSVIANATLITRAVGNRPYSIAVHRDASGIIYAFTADFESNRFSVCALSETDGILSSSVISNAVLITKSVGSRPHSIAVHRNIGGALYVFTADLIGNSFSACALSGIDGILSSSVIANATLITRAVGAFPHSVAIRVDGVGILYVFTADTNSNRISICDPGSAHVGIVVPSPLNFSIVNGNTATVSISRTYFVFQQLVIDRDFSPFPSNFQYVRTGTLSGIVLAGKTLIFSTADSDITEAGSIRIEGTLRLGRKAGLYSAPFVFTNGSTIEAFPDSDRAGAPLNLTNQVFNAITTINVTSGTATVSVPSLAGIVAGAGVTLQAPQRTITLAGMPNGAEVRLLQGSKTIDYRANITDGNYSYSYLFVPGERVRFAITSPGFVSQFFRLELADSNQSLPIELVPDPFYIS